MKTRFNRFHVISFFIIIISAVILSILLYKFRHFTFDDSFITFRYSRLTALGYGPRFNPAGSPAEGYTSFLWMLIMVIPHLLNIDVVMFSKIAGIIFLLLTLYFAFMLAKNLTLFIRDDLRNIFGSLAVLLIVLFNGSLFHTVTGMETMQFTFLLVFFSYVNIRFLEQLQLNKLNILFISGFLIGITRPEGNLFVIITALFTYILLPKELRIKFIKKFILFYLLPGSIYFLWRLWYYKSFLPLPFYVKVTEKRTYFAGAEEVWGFLRYFSVTLILVILGVVINLRKTLPLFIALCSIIAFFTIPQHIMGFQWRFLYPISPLLIILLIGGVSLAFNESSCFIKSLNLRLVPVILVTGIIGAGFVRPLPQNLIFASDYTKGLNNAHIILGKVLNSISDADFANVVAVGDAGAIPYYSMWMVIDTFGLNDPFIARTWNHDPAYVFAKDPDVVVLISSSPDVFIARLSWEQKIYEDSIRRGYKKVKSLVFYENNYYLWIMAIPDSKIGLKLAKWN